MARARYGRREVVRSGATRTERSLCFTPNGSGRAFAITLANGDARRAGTSTCCALPARIVRPEDYLSKSYYQIWLAGLERLMQGSVT